MVCTAAKHMEVVILLGLLYAKTAAYACAVNMQGKLNMHQQVFFVAGVAFLGVCAFIQSPVDCSTCLENYRVLLKSIKNHMLRYVYLEDLFQQYFGPNSDLNLIATKDGVVPKWPKCYVKWKDQWDPCDVFKVTKIELSCKI